MSSRIALAACVLLVLACQPDQSVGLGHFHVVASRGANACGAQSMELVPQVEYDVELKVNAAVLNWVPASATSAAGVWNPQLHSFRIVLEQDTVAWQPDRRYDIVGCTLHRTDVIEGTVEYETADAGTDAGTDADQGQLFDAGTDAGTDGGSDASVALRARAFRATETIVFGPAPGSDCRALIGAGDGQFSTMPCDVTYSLVGQRL